MTSSLPLKTATLLESLMLHNQNALLESALSIQRASFASTVVCGLSGLTFSYAIACTEKAAVVSLLFKAAAATMSYGACFESYKLHKCSRIIIERATTRKLQENGQIQTNVVNLATRLHNEARGTFFTKWLLHAIG